MHLLEAASKTFTCVPFTHEVSAVIAAEYFNETSPTKAWVLVTAGPGLTNALTGIAGAWLESRELLVVGGQVKSSDLVGESGVRQRGIQEIDGLSLTRSITKAAVRVNEDTELAVLADQIRSAGVARKGPVFIEVPLDMSGREFPILSSEASEALAKEPARTSYSEVEEDVEFLVSRLSRGKRPVFLIGQGLNKSLASELAFLLAKKGIPVATSWTGADRVGVDSPNFIGRPNFFGMRASNIITQQADLLITLGARLGLQQTGFNQTGFAPHAQIISVEIDPTECSAPFERGRHCINQDCELVVPLLIKKLELLELDFDFWLDHCKEVMSAFPLVETPEHQSHEFINPYVLISELGTLVDDDELIVPCSSGGTFTAFMQCFRNSSNQRIISNKGLASMGYGLAGAIGVGLANPTRRVLHLEGDGGFLQNLQELGTIPQQGLNIKSLIFDNSGYASIRTTQKRYFGGNYVGCDNLTGLGIPRWKSIAEAYGLEFVSLTVDNWRFELIEAINSSQATIVRVPVNPEFEYLPKISSRVLDDGTMESNPLHIMEPKVTDAYRTGLIDKFMI